MTSTAEDPKPAEAPPTLISPVKAKETETKPEVSVTAEPPQQHKHEDEDPLKVKSEFILSSLHPTLTPLIERRSDDRGTTNDTNNKEKGNRHRKNKRELKKRSREQHNNQSNVCKAFLSGKGCPYGDNCKYSHDLKEILSNREEDIKEIGSCPHYDLKGSCPYGLNCRVGSKHLNLATGENINKSEEEIAELNKIYDTKVMNLISRDVSNQLRKRKYKFACKRYNDKTKGNKKKEEQSVDKKEEVEKTVKKDEAEAKVNHMDVKKGDAVAKEEEKGDNADGSCDGSKMTDDVEMKRENGEQKQTAATATTPATTVVVDETKPKDDAKPTTTPPPPKTNTTKGPIDLSPLPKTRKLIDFSNKVYVAPLTTVGNLPFRRVMKKFSADITCGEMAVGHNLLQGKNGEWALLKRHPDEDVFGVQIAAGHADVYTRISEIIENEGLDIDFLDMNLGCPIDVLCNQGCGARLMLRENKLRDSLIGMTSVLSIPVTVKIRTGWDEKKPFAHKLVPKIQKWGVGGGVAAVMVHGRSRLQRYSKSANWDYIQQVNDAQSSDIPKFPLIGNGDIFSYTDYEEKVLKHEGLSKTAMIGRGALIKPWLPIEIKERRHWDISASERLDFLKDFVKFGLEHWGSDQQGVNTTRRFLLEWLSFLYRYIPVGMLEVLPQHMNQRPPAFMCGRNDLETLMLSKNSKDWVKISEMLLGPVPDGFEFEAKHKANSYKS